MADVTAEQRTEIEAWMQRSLDALRNNGIKISPKNEILYQHIMAAGAIAALAVLDHKPPASWGMAMLSGRPILEKK